MIWIKDFPLPPSVNEYMFPRKGGGWAKTQKFRDYKQQFLIYKLQNRLILENHTKNIKMWRDKGLYLSVDAYFVFHRERLFTKKGFAKKIDANNFLKPLLDGVSECLDIDDSLFFSGLCEKVSTEKKVDECTIIKISPHQPRTKENLMATWS